MTFKKRHFLILVVLVAISLVAGCSQTTKKTAPTNQIRVTYQLQNDGDQIAKKSVHVKKNATVLTGLKKAWSVKLQKGMVTQIGKHKQDTNKNIYWTYKINGKTAKKGVQQQKVKNKDKVTFNLSQYKEK